MDLQFQHAEVLPHPTQDESRLCVVCKNPTGHIYYHAQGQVVCPICAQRIQSGQQAPPVSSLGRAILYGSGAALAGCALYAIVAISTGLQIGWIALIVGIMVGKAIRYASNGMGGRPQQILAVLLTYFAISTSFVPVLIYDAAKHPEQFRHSTSSATSANQPEDSVNSSPERVSPARAIIMLVLILAAAPFLGLASVSGWITLFIIFIGLQRAWKLTARPDILIMGPYESAPAQ